MWEPPQNYHLCCSSVGRTLEDFKTSVTVAAHKKVTFELTYEELLKRKLGKYELLIHARPMQPVKDFKVRLFCWYVIRAGVMTSSMVRASNCFILFYPQCQVDVYINEKSGINFIEVKGGLSTNALTNAITKTHADKEVQLAEMQNIVYWVTACCCTIVLNTVQ